MFNKIVAAIFTTATIAFILAIACFEVPQFLVIIALPIGAIATGYLFAVIFELNS